MVNKISFNINGADPRNVLFWNITTTYNSLVYFSFSS